MQHLAALPRVTGVEHEPHDGTPYGIERVRIAFENGYSASMVRGEFTYGGKEGLWEAAVTYDGEIVYDTPVTSDVIGHLHSEHLPDVLMQIADLPPR